jgi:hypothetical protein
VAETDGLGSSGKTVPSAKGFDGYASRCDVAWINDDPIGAPAYAAQRRAFAKGIGLGDRAVSVAGGIGAPGDPEAAAAGCDGVRPVIHFLGTSL